MTSLSTLISMLPLLGNGGKLTCEGFERCYTALLQGKKAKLI